MKKHTPGPWFFETVGVSDLGNPEDICEITNGHQRIAEYVLEHDARLIAAAPELLAALMRAQYHLEGQEYLDALAVIRNAINKVKGE